MKAIFSIFPVNFWPSKMTSQSKNTRDGNTVIYMDGLAAGTISVIPVVWDGYFKEKKTYALSDSSILSHFWFMQMKYELLCKIYAYILQLLRFHQYLKPEVMSSDKTEKAFPILLICSKSPCHFFFIRKKNSPAYAKTIHACKYE